MLFLIVTNIIYADGTSYSCIKPFATIRKTHNYTVTSIKITR